MKNFFITCKEARIENHRSFYGSFYLGPFNAEQSVTIANALKRTLLSECPGIGIISVTIENVSHEYSTLPGMSESVLDLILNLKEIVLKKKKTVVSLYKKKTNTYEKVGNSFFKPVVGFLKVKGPAVIHAKDLKLPPFIECVDPEQYIATLAEDGYLSLQFIIMEGKGFFIQKNNSFIDDKLVKSRIDLLNQFQNSNSSSFLKPPFSTLPISKAKAEITNKKSEESDSRFEKGEKKVFNTLTFNKRNEGQEKDNPLNLDTVFNPVTKISYIIEELDNKLSADSGHKLNFIDDISSLLESSNYLKQNLPLLNNQISLNEDNFSKFFETYTPDEIQKITNSLHPLKKQSSLHSIVLEIWTNGSLHPREALHIGFQNLATAFLNLQKTEKSNFIYLNETSFQKSLTLVDESALLSSSYIKLQNNFESSEAYLNFDSKENTYLGKQNNAENLENTNIVNKLTPSVSNLEHLKTNILSTVTSFGIEFLNLPKRPYTLLKRVSINTVGDLCNLTINDLMHIFNKESNIQTPLAKKYMKTIITNLTQKGLSLKEVNDPLSLISSR